MRKSTLILIIGIFSVLLLGVGAIYLALRLQGKVGPGKGRAAPADNCCNEPDWYTCPAQRSWDDGYYACQAHQCNICCGREGESCENGGKCCAGYTCGQDGRCHSGGNSCDLQRCARETTCEFPAISFCQSENCGGDGKCYCDNPPYDTTCCPCCKKDPLSFACNPGGQNVCPEGEVFCYTSVDLYNGTPRDPNCHAVTSCTSACPDCGNTTRVYAYCKSATQPPPVGQCNDECTPSGGCADGLACMYIASENKYRCRHPDCSGRSDCICRCNDPCSENSDCESGLICFNERCRNNQCPTETDCSCGVATQNPACGSLIVEGVNCAVTPCQTYAGTQLTLKVTGQRGNPAANVTRFLYSDTGSNWHTISGGNERGDFNYEEGVNGITWRVPSDLGFGNFKVWGGIGYVPTPNSGGLGDDLAGRMCGGNETTALVPKDPSYTVCDQNIDGNCSCVQGDCLKDIHVLKPPTCDNLELLSSNCTNSLPNEIHPGDSICLRVTGSADSTLTILSYRHGYLLSDGSTGVFLPDPIENRDRVITINSTNIPGFNESIQWVDFGASVIDSNNFECNGHGELVDRNQNPPVVVGICTSNCLKRVSITRTPQLNIDKFVKEIDGHVPTESCQDPASKQCRSDDLSGSSTVTYIVRLTNAGETTLHNVVLTDFVLFNGAPPSGVPLPWRITLVQPLRECADPSCGTYGSGSSNGTINNGGLDASWESIDMSAGAVWQAELTVAASMTTGSNRFDNIAKVTSDGFCLPPVGCSDDVYHFEGVPVSIYLEKSSDVEPPTKVHPGESVQFTVTVSPANRVINNVEVTDYLGDKFEDYFTWPPSPISVSKGSYVLNQSDHIIVWSIPTLSSTETLTFTVIVNPDLHLSPPDCMIYYSNSVLITAPTQGVVLPPSRDVWVIIEDPNCSISSNWKIVKDATPSTVAPGGNVVFTLTITNSGNQGDYIRTVRDTLPQGFTYQDECTVVKPNGTTFTCTPTVSGYSIEWSFPSSGENSVFLEPGQNMIITFKAKAPITPGAYVNIACLIIPTNGCDDAVVYVSPGTAINKLVPVITAGLSMIVFGLITLKNRFLEDLIAVSCSGLREGVEKIKSRILPTFEERVEKKTEETRKKI